jgi:hypothetical protein
MITLCLHQNIRAAMLAASILCSSSVFGQFHVSFELPDGSKTGGSSAGSGGGSAPNTDKVRQFYADKAMHEQTLQLQASRSSQRIIIAAGAIDDMTITKARASKYPYVRALYIRSLAGYAKMEPVSVAAADAIRQGRDISVYESQENQIMSAAVEDYHKGQYVLEMEETETTLIQEAKMTFIAENCLSKEEMAELNVLKIQIKDAQQQIAQFHRSGKTMAQMNDQLSHNYQTIIVAVKGAAKITEDEIKLIVPNQKLVKGINVTEKVFETYVEEAYSNGHSPEEAVKRAFLQGLFQLIKEQKPEEEKNPIEKVQEAEKVFFDGLRDVVEDWQKLDQERRETMEKVNEAIESTDDLIRWYQRRVNAAAARGEALTKRCLNDYGKKVLP